MSRYLIRTPNFEINQTLDCLKNVINVKVKCSSYRELIIRVLKEKKESNLFEQLNFIKFQLNVNDMMISRFIIHSFSLNERVKSYC